MIGLIIVVLCVVVASVVELHYVPADPFKDGRLRWVREIDEDLRRRGYVVRTVAWNRNGRLTRVVWSGPPGVQTVEAEW